MYIAGCCKTAREVKLYYGEAKNEFKDTRTEKMIMQYEATGEYDYTAFNSATDDLFKGTICYRTTHSG